ncbi:MAG TPA: GpE family phage tail protein [Roseateles sp.]
MAELAYVFHWPPSELDALTVDEIEAWHVQAKRLMDRVNKPN